MGSLFFLFLAAIAGAAKLQVQDHSFLVLLDRFLASCVEKLITILL